jgi:excisionase family DNA binding protein
MPKQLTDERVAKQKDRLLKIVDVQERCSVSRSKAYSMLDDGLPFLKIGGAIRVRESALEEFLDQCAAKD